MSKFVEDIITALRASGGLDSSYLSRKAEAYAEDLFNNDRHVLEAYMIVKAVEKLGENTLMMEARKWGQEEEYQRFIREFDAEEHLEDSFKIERK